ncbi:MAG: rubrerythrin family protein [Elusimicrobiales bacterium]|jgi:rubrerythrin
MNNMSRVVLIMLGVPALAAVVNGASTSENMRTAYNRELNTRLRYEAFAAKADAEGYAGVAGVLRAIAFSESIHAANHYKAMSAPGPQPADPAAAVVPETTKENLKAALRAEMNESGKIYPAFVKQAIAEGDARSIMSLKGAMASEGGHARIFSKLLKKTGEWKRKIAIIVCRTCGYSSDDPNLKICPFCTHPRGEFAEM